MFSISPASGDLISGSSNSNYLLDKPSYLPEKVTYLKNLKNVLYKLYVLNNRYLHEYVLIYTLIFFKILDKPSYLPEKVTHLKN